METSRPVRRWPLVLLLGLTIAWFAPVLAGGRIFISDNYLGAFFLPLQWWSDLLNSGHPLYADLNFGNGYPIRIAFSALADVLGRASAYNLFVWSAFAIGALGTYSYVFELAADSRAAVVSGAAFAFSAFMQAHVGHETMIHSAAWLPWVILFTHRIIERHCWHDVALLALSAALMYLANHPEIYLQIALISTLYALWIARRSRARLRAGLMLCAGWGISVLMVAWQLAGAWEFATMSERFATARTLTLVGALPVDEIAQTVLPWVFGAAWPTRLAPVPNFGYEMKMEIASYVAPAVLLLSALGIASQAASRAARFWLAASLFFFVLALGPQTLIGESLFFAPGFSLFRIPGRNVLTFHFGLSVLCGLGAFALFRRDAALAGRRWIWLWGLLPTLVAAAFYPVVASKAALVGVALPVLWKNVAVTTPIFIALVSTIALVAAWRAPPRIGFGLVMATIIGGSAYFGWNSPWLVASGGASAMLDETPVVAELKQLARPDEERILAADGWLGPSGVEPNQSMLFGLRNVSGYGPLLTREYADLTGLTNGGWIRPLAFDSGSVTLDVLGTRWVFPYATSGSAKTFEKAGMRWDSSPFGKVLGGACGDAAPLDQSVAFNLPNPGKVGKVALVTSLGCALELPQGTVVAHVVLEGRDSRGALRIPIRAGVETSEWSAACYRGDSQSRHPPSRIFDSTEIPAVAPGCEGHHYVTQLPALGWDADRMRIDWDLPSSAFPRTTMRVQHVTIVGPDERTMQPLQQTDMLFADTARWRRHRLASGQVVYENLRARPLAWLVGTATSMPSNDAAISAVRSGKLPDGTRFEPAQTALTIEPVPLPEHAGAARSADIAHVRHWQSGNIVVDVQTQTPALLVLSQRFYPGWKAQVDGHGAPILHVDGGLQGVEVPSGSHGITLEFAPPRLPWLLLVAAITLFGVAALLVIGSRPGKRPPLVHGN